MKRPDQFSSATSRKPAPRLKGIVVALPALNEQELIAQSLMSVQAAVKNLSTSLATVTSLACDSCTDDTVTIANRFELDDERFLVQEGRWRSVGQARRAAVAFGIERLLAEGVSLEEMWIATTDADTTVGPTWLVEQVRFANDGVDAIAGTVRLLSNADLTPETEECFGEMYHIAPHDHSHVHGANLGVRASAYLAAGGFPPLATSEDRTLWTRLLNAGYRCHASTTLSVATSARLHGRVDEGFAYALRNWQPARHNNLELSRAAT